MSSLSLSQFIASLAVLCFMTCLTANFSLLHLAYAFELRSL